MKDRDFCLQVFSRAGLCYDAPMSAKILNGKIIRDERLPEIMAQIKGLISIPVLSIIQVGDRADSNSYIQAKKNFATKVGLETQHIKLPENISTQDLINVVEKFNEETKTKAIIVQLPLPLHIDRDAVIETIDPNKDVDALTSANVKFWLEGREDAIMPATARGVRHLLSYYGISLFGKKVCVVGRSMLIGKPIALMCLNENASVSICHSKTQNLEEETKNADILIVAIGKPNFINEKYVRSGQIVVDVGISKNEQGILVGDVDFNKVSSIVQMISPVPGGVGPMTVLSLFENLLDLSRRSEL